MDPRVALTLILVTCNVSVRLLAVTLASFFVKIVFLQAVSVTRAQATQIQGIIGWLVVTSKQSNLALALQ